MPRGQISGFDYRIQRPVTKLRKEWIADMAKIVKAGGKRRIENGETFVHAKGAAMQFEVYATLPAVSA